MGHERGKMTNQRVFVGSPILLLMPSTCIHCPFMLASFISLLLDTKLVGLVIRWAHLTLNVFRDHIVVLYSGIVNLSTGWRFSLRSEYVLGRVCKVYFLTMSKKLDMGFSY